MMVIRCFDRGPVANGSWRPGPERHTWCMARDTGQPPQQERPRNTWQGEEGSAVLAGLRTDQTHAKTMGIDSQDSLFETIHRTLWQGEHF